MQTLSLNVEAYELFHEGMLTFADMEINGINIDISLCKTNYTEIGREIKKLEKKISIHDIVQSWKSKYGKDYNIDSNQQLADVLFEEMDYEPVKMISNDKPSTDQEALEALGLDVVTDLIRIRKLKKVRNTNIKGLIQETIDGILHPFFNLHLARTFRSCIAKGTYILVARSGEKTALSIPIEDIKAGDYVYCFDDDLNPAIQRVNWSGKTGYRTVIRLHWKAGPRKDFLDVTPEHLIRHIHGAYIRADKTDNDYRDLSIDSKHSPKCHVLACKRCDDELFFTGHLKNGRGIKEHRFLYEQFIGPLKKSDIIHHKDTDHYNHDLKNLEKHTKVTHASLHAPNTIRTKQAIKNNRKAIKQGWKEGRYPIRYGKNNPNYLDLSKIDCLRFLSKHGGKVTQACKQEHIDFNTFKKYCKLHNINLKEIKLRYDKFGKYISKKKLKYLSKLGRASIQKILGHNHSRLLKLYKLYNINPQRLWANQAGAFKVGNHAIIRIEILKEKVDVYDIEVEKYHNFFANEICVHNSSSNPNFQNMPTRDLEFAKLIRRAIIPRPGRLFVESDYESIEVSASAWNHHDPRMLEYLHDNGTDMHADMAVQIYLLDQFDKNTGDKTLRKGTKNGFIFPQFYGDYWGNNAIALWNWAGLSGKRPKGGVILSNGIPIGEWLYKKGIKSFEKFEKHIKAIEEDFWNNRFSVYKQWKEDKIFEYETNGFIETLTGFTCQNFMDNKMTTNYPVQSVAFHCLLWAAIKVNKLLKKYKMKSMLIGQIHDSLIGDVVEKELNDYLDICKQVMCHDIKKHWKWINTPLGISIEASDRSWFDTEVIASYRGT